MSKLLTLVLFALIFSVTANAKCLRMTSCSAGIPRPDRCTIDINWINCDGSNGGRLAACVNRGCINSCRCECTNVGYTMSWCDSCSGAEGGETFACTGCS